MNTTPIRCLISSHIFAGYHDASRPIISLDQTPERLGVLSGIAGQCVTPEEVGEIIAGLLCLNPYLPGVDWLEIMVLYTTDNRSWRNMHTLRFLNPNAKNQSLGAVKYLNQEVEKAA